MGDGAALDANTIIATLDEATAAPRPGLPPRV